MPTFSKKIGFDPFWAHRGDFFCGFSAAGHILWLAYSLTVPAAPKGQVHVRTRRRLAHRRNGDRAQGVPVYG